MKQLTLILLLWAPSIFAKFRFDNYTLYKILPQNEEHIKILQNLEDTDVRYDFWSDPVPGAEYVNIMSSPELKTNLENLLKNNAIGFEIVMPNVQAVIDKEERTVRKYDRSLRNMNWDSYYPLQDIYTWLDDLAITYPEIVTPIVGGTTYENREIRGIKISHGSGRRAIFIEGGIHSREWISPAVVNYITNELLTNDHPETVAAARDFDWYIFPVTNPDGYIWTHKEFRLWRKNRRPVGNEFGIDLNRNWNNNWLVIGASTNPSSNTYAGLGPFSEPETRTLSNYITSIGDQIDIYLSFHSSGQLLMVPFGNTTEPLANYDETIGVGRRAMGALAVRYRTEYTTGNVAETIYHASGSSIDWIKETLRVPLTYCYELRDRGVYGHLLPAEQILPTGQETMDSVLEIIHQGKRFGIINGCRGLTASVIVLIVTLINLVFTHF